MCQAAARHGEHRGTLHRPPGASRYRGSCSAMGTKCGGAEGRGEGGPQPHVSVVLSYFLCLFPALVAEGMCSVRGSQAQIREDQISALGTLLPR